MLAKLSKMAASVVIYIFMFIQYLLGLKRINFIGIDIDNNLLMK